MTRCARIHAHRRTTRTRSAPTERLEQEARKPRVKRRLGRIVVGCFAAPFTGGGRKQSAGLHRNNGQVGGRDVGASTRLCAGVILRTMCRARRVSRQRIDPLVGDVLGTGHLVAGRYRDRPECAGRLGDTQPHGGQRIARYQDQRKRCHEATGRAACSALRMQVSVQHGDGSIRCRGQHTLDGGQRRPQTGGRPPISRPRCASRRGSRRTVRARTGLCRLALSSPAAWVP